MHIQAAFITSRQSAQQETLNVKLICEIKRESPKECTKQIRYDRA